MGRSSRWACLLLAAVYPARADGAAGGPRHAAAPRIEFPYLGRLARRKTDGPGVTGPNGAWSLLSTPARNEGAMRRVKAGMRNSEAARIHSIPKPARRNARRTPTGAWSKWNGLYCTDPSSNGDQL